MQLRSRTVVTSRFFVDAPRVKRRDVGKVMDLEDMVEGRGKRKVKMELETMNKRVKLETEVVVKVEEGEMRTVETAVETTVKTSTKKKKVVTKKVKMEMAEPENWKTVYDLIKEFRTNNIAPVDEMGCGGLASTNETPEVYRFQTLTALMLSSQTKDPITASAITRLKSLPNATLQNVLHGVGFHVKKTVYLRGAATICVEQYGGDIPGTLEGLLAIPGVGPKMAYLAMQCAWGQNVGVGVDTHVHRISNRLGWVKSKEAEETREDSAKPSATPSPPVAPACPVSHLCPKTGVKQRGGKKKAGTEMSWVGGAVKEEEENGDVMEEVVKAEG
ncbi:DNA glycosylase [Chytridium lagenaria]|nr:DNA glycosylase [Chytridium lagenaria]